MVFVHFTLLLVAFILLHISSIMDIINGSSFTGYTAAFLTTTLQIYYKYITSHTLSVSRPRPVGWGGIGGLGDKPPRRLSPARHIIYVMVVTGKFRPNSTLIFLPVIKLHKVEMLIRHRHYLILLILTPAGLRGSQIAMQLTAVPNNKLIT